MANTVGAEGLSRGLGTQGSGQLCPHSHNELASVLRVLK